MDRKNRVWLITLIVLLVASIVGLVLVKNQWDASESSYVRANAQLSEEQSSSEKLRAELDGLNADLENKATEIEALKAELEAANAELAAHQLATAAPVDEITPVPTDETTSAPEAQAAADPAVNALQGALKTAGEKADALDTEIAASQPDNEAANTAITELKTALDSASVQASALPSGDPIGDLNTILQTASEQVTVLEDSLKDAISIGETAIEAGVTELKDALEAAQTKMNALNTAEPAVQDDSEAQLKQAQDEVARLTEALDQAQAQVAALESQLADAQANSDSLESQLTDAQAQADSLREQLAQAQADSAALTEELNSTRETLSQRIAALEAYLAERELGAGEAHSSTTAATTIHIAADGKTGTWDYTNNTVSGNSVVLTLAIGQNELFRSESLAPGAALNEIQLNTALTAGKYDAVATTAIYADDGTYLFANRIPVTLEVAAE